jgi:hypothetical protein
MINYHPGNSQFLIITIIRKDFINPDGKAITFQRLFSENTSKSWLLGIYRTLALMVYK